MEPSTHEHKDGSREVGKFGLCEAYVAQDGYVFQHQACLGSWK